MTTERLHDVARGGGLLEAALGGFRAGEAVLAHAGFPGLPGQLEVRTVSAYRRGPAVVLPVRWVLDGAEEGVAPPFDADLELDPNPDGTCRLILRGSYRPPVGRLGGTLDWLVMRRVAEATTHEFLTRLGRELQQPPPPGPAAAPTLDETGGRAAPSLRVWTAEPEPSAVAGAARATARDVGSVLEVLDSAARYAVRSIGEARWAG